MKRIITLSVILVATGILMPSCGTHLTIAKRQHSRGYHVDISSDKKSKHKQAESVEIGEESELATESPKAKKSSTIGSRHVVKKTEENTEAAVFTENKAVGVSAAQTAVEVQEKKTAKTLPVLAHKSFDNSIAENVKSNAHETKSTVKNGIKKFTESKQFKKMESKQAASGLSLFWIVILILLILWALGLIGGLGWFIHLALVVALILLILWLLGIV